MLELTYSNVAIQKKIPEVKSPDPLTTREGDKGRGGEDKGKGRRGRGRGRE